MDISCPSNSIYSVNESIMCPLLISLPFQYNISYSNGINYLQPNIHTSLTTVSAKRYTRFFGALLLTDNTNQGLTNSPNAMYILTSCEFEFMTKISGFYMIAKKSGNVKVQVGLKP